ncbi:MAG: D-aminoacyl-tRNA deacylase [Pseudomonadales bacterium]
MLALIQRVSEASVSVDNETRGKVGSGLVVLLGVQKHDTKDNADKLLEKILAYRVFPDDAGHMNLSLLDVGGELLVVSQFTLAADTRKGLRPSFSSAAGPEHAESLYNYFVESALGRLGRVHSGVFGAHMAVSLVNDGPVTFLLER